MTEPARMLHGDTVFRIDWVLGTDLLRGVCHCHAERESEDPVELWEWLLAHPEGHEPPAAAEPVREPVTVGATS
jgi:hypothetical protein